MRLATLANGTPDGALIVVSADNKRFWAGPAPTMQSVLENWSEHQDALATLTAQLAAGGGEPLAEGDLLAPLPRAWQWLDGSAFATHGMLMERAYNLEPIPFDPPLLYQGLSHRFLAPTEDVVLRSIDCGLDFEAEFGVITDAVPMGVSAQEAIGHIKLVVAINDWSQRAFTPSELKRGFGWMHAKPASSVAPIAVTPDELGEGWADGRVRLPIEVRRNGVWFGSPNGGEMGFGFHDIIAYAAQTRDLPAGTILGSGTVSNENFRACGSACIAERRAIEMIDTGAPQTGFLTYGETVTIEARSLADEPLFGKLEQRVVPFN